MPFQGPPPPEQKRPAVTQESKGDHSPNVVTGNNSTVIINSPHDVMDGVIEPAKLLFSNQSNMHSRLEIGDSNSIIPYLGALGSPLLVLGGDPVIIERLKDGSVAVTTTIRDRTGKIIAEIIQNHWKLRPSLLWDRNFNSNAVEVRDEFGDIVLQAQALPDRIRLQGIWRTKDGGLFEMVKSPDPANPGGLYVALREN